MNPRAIVCLGIPYCPEPRCGSGRLPMIEVEEPPEARETLNRARYVVVIRERTPGTDEASANALVDARYCSAR
jgi:hypothetical protein